MAEFFNAVEDKVQAFVYSLEYHPVITSNILYASARKM